MYIRQRGVFMQQFPPKKYFLINKQLIFELGSPVGRNSGRWTGKIPTAAALFCQARKRFRSRTSLWERMRALFVGYFIDDWETYWQSIAYGHQATRLANMHATL